MLPFSAYGERRPLLGLIANTKFAFNLIAYATVACLLITMPMNIAFTGSHLFNVLQTQHFVSVGVDVSLFLIGVLMFVAINKSKQVAKKKEDTLELDEQALVGS